MQSRKGGRSENDGQITSLLPIWATTIIFWATYAQMITFSVEQASTMERSIGNFQIPEGSLSVCFVAPILITLAVYDRIIMPFWKKWKGKPGIGSIPILVCHIKMPIFADENTEYKILVLFNGYPV